MSEGAALGQLAVRSGRRRAADHRLAAGRVRRAGGDPARARAVPARLHAAGGDARALPARARAVGGGLARRRGVLGRLPRSLGSRADRARRRVRRARPARLDPRPVASPSGTPWPRTSWPRRRSVRRERRLRCLSWYERVRRPLPWRATRDPYALLVSEVMLQQTQALRVVPYYERWLAVVPDAASLAAAPIRDVLAQWSGLGYNRRALSLQRAPRGSSRARLAVRSDDAAGVGPYTAAAVASFAFDRAGRGRRHERAARAVAPGRGAASRRERAARAAVLRSRAAARRRSTRR